MNDQRESGIDEIGKAFERAGEARRAALITYLTVGYPTPRDTPGLLKALEQGGADLIELGVPFSDPVADGPTIQAASVRALQEGVTPKNCLDLVSMLRAEGLGCPLLLMGYYNPILSYGVQEYVRDCAAAGVAGLIVPDLPPEEAGELRAACSEKGLALVFLVAPTSSEARIERIAQETTGFLYVISRLGITGAESRPEERIERRLQMIKRYARTPVAVGFGISRPEQAAALAPYADGLIVGSAVVSEAGKGAEAMRQLTASLAAALAR